MWTSWCLPSVCQIWKRLNSNLEIQVGWLKISMLLSLFLETGTKMTNVTDLEIYKLMWLAPHACTRTMLNHEGAVFQFEVDRIETWKKHLEYRLATTSNHCFAVAATMTIAADTAPAAIDAVTATLYYTAATAAATAGLCCRGSYLMMLWLLNKVYIGTYYLCEMCIEEMRKHFFHP